MEVWDGKKRGTTLSVPRSSFPYSFLRVPRGTKVSQTSPSTRIPLHELCWDEDGDGGETFIFPFQVLYFPHSSHSRRILLLSSRRPRRLLPPFLWDPAKALFARDARGQIMRLALGKLLHLK